jgi:PAS domain S-box-containing protein
VECKALFGLPFEAVVTDDLFFSRVHEDDRAAVSAAIEQAFDPEGSGEYHSEYRTLWPDGTLRWVDARGRATFDKVAGLRRAVRFIGTVLDITEAKRTEETLARHNQELRAVANSAPALIWVAAPDGPVHYVNDQWCRYTGQTPDEAIGNGWFSVLHPEDAGAIAAAWGKARAIGTSYEVECRYRRSDDVYRRQLVRAEPMRDADGTITAWVGTSMDINDYVSRIAEARGID